MSQSTAEERRWIVFDGPIDSQWMENLNTLLDDSKKLCLMNGEIIPLAEPWMNLLFEMDGLSTASPAIVSRTGIACMESHSLGWVAVKDSFVEALPDRAFDADRIDCLNDLFEWLVPAVLKEIRVSVARFLICCMVMFTHPKTLSAILVFPVPPLPRATPGQVSTKLARLAPRSLHPCGNQEEERRRPAGRREQEFRRRGWGGDRQQGRLH